jgi:uncharacterized lipoprotein YddW (UPF0748 family)
LRSGIIFCGVIIISTGIYLSTARCQVLFPKREVRAAFIATVLGLDWPKSFDPEEQQRSLREIVEKLSAARFNTIYFQVRGRADAMYHSQYEPWSAQLTGTLGKDPGWDPLDFLLKEAHAHGMEVHAWFNTILVKNGGPQPELSEPLHVMLSHPEWMHQVEGEWWFDPGLPAVKNYIINVAMDIVRGYDIDGFEFDYLRYPQLPFHDEATYRKYGHKTPKDDWRRENINAIARIFHDSVMVVKPGLKIGSTPIGIYLNRKQMRGLQSYSELYQDSRRWLLEGWQDYLAPQVYWPLGSSTKDPDFGAVVRDWVEHAYGKHLYIGIGAYKPEVAPQISLLIDTSRSSGVEGNAFFRYSNISALLGVEKWYPTRAFPPPMKWKDSIPPNPPRDVQLKNLGDKIFSLQWRDPLPGSDRQPPRWYVVYRSDNSSLDITRGDNVLVILPSSRTGYIDTIGGYGLEECSYAVTALNRADIESPPVSGRMIIPEIVDLARMYRPVFALRQIVRDPDMGKIFVPYELPARLPVQLKIVDEKNNEVMRVVDTVQEAGRHVAAADIHRLREGSYASIITANEYYSRTPFTIKK